MGSGNLNSTRILMEHKFTRVNVRNKVPQNPFNEYTLNTIKFHLRYFRPLSQSRTRRTVCSNPGCSNGINIRTTKNWTGTLYLGQKNQTADHSRPAVRKIMIRITGDKGFLAWTWLTSCGYGFNLDEMFALMSDDPPMWHVT